MTISFELSQEQIATNQQKKQEMIDAAQLDLIAGNQFVFFAAFDGTNNDLNTRDPLDTNVAQLWRQYQQNFGGRVGGQYYPGPGTKGTLTASSWLYPQVTEQVVKQAKQAYEDFRDQASNWLRKNPNGSVAVALAAFSRGSASAAIFSQLLFEGGLIDTRSDTVLIAPSQIQLSAGVLFDPVTTGVQGNLAFAPNTRNVIDVLANNEYRQAFKAADYSGQPGITKVSMIGNHSDIGGPYDRGIGALSLEAATTFLQRSGIPVGNVQSNRTFLGGTVLIHDEGLNPDGSEAWSEYGSYLQGSQRLFDTVVTSTPMNGDLAKSLVLYNGDRLTIIAPSPTAPASAKTEKVQIDHEPTAFEMIKGVMFQDISNYYSANDSFYKANKADEIVQTLGALGATETVTARVFVANDNLPIEIIRKAQTIKVDVKAVNGVKLDSLASSSVGIKPDVNGALTSLSGNTINNDGNNKWIDAASTLYDFKPSTRGQKVGTLTITQGALGEDRVIINNFDLAQAQKQGFLGIRLGTLEVAIKPGASANPFDDPNFDEANASTPSSIVADGDANSYTIFLPYAADEGGQRIHLKFEGADADKLAVIANGQTLTVANGEFDVTIAQGERALTFAVLEEESVAADASLTLQATLTDAQGNATHQTHTELTLTLAAPADPTTADQAFTNTISGDQTPLLPDDVLFGTAANDRIIAGEGNDYVFGDEGKDWIQGGNGGDSLFGVQGNDLIEGGAGSDIIGGGEGDDRLFADSRTDKAAALASDATAAGATTDFLDGYYGDDQLVGSTGADVLLGGAGADLLIGGAGNDVLYGDRDGVYSGTTTSIQATIGEVNPEGGDDTLFGGGGDDTMYGEIGDDALFGNAGDDVMYGDAEDLLAAYHGDDYLDGGAGNDFLVGGLGNDDLIGGAGDDHLYGDSSAFAVALHGDDYLEGGAGNDYLDGMGGSDILSGGEGDDVLAGGEGDDELYGGEGADQLDGGAGDDYLDAGAGDDIAQGGEGKDTIYGEDGDDLLIGDRGADDPDGGDDDWMEGGAGNDALFGQGGDDTLFGDEGNDQLMGGLGDDYLDGGEGDDVLMGEAGDDTLAGGAGQDVLIGGAGRDTYVLERGDGQDFAVDSLFAAGDPEASVVTLGAGISRDDVRLHVGAASIDLGSGPTDYVTLVVDAGGGDSIAFAGFNPQNPGTASLFDGLQFADGTTLAYAEVLDLGVDTAGTDGDDFIAGTALADRIDGGAGNDTLLGNAGDDVLIGGTGNDELIGGSGKDTYVFNPGDGIDVVQEQPLLAGSADASVLELGTGDFTLRLDVDDSMMVDLGGGDRISFRGFDPELPFLRPVLGELRAAGASYSFEELLARGFDLDGSAADDVMHGTAVTDRIAGFAGNDRIDGRDGDDVIDGGAGDDVITGGDGNDTIIGGDGADILQGGAGDDTIFAGADDVVLDSEGTNHLDLTAFAGLNAANLEITQYEADGGDLYLSFHVRDAGHVGETPASGDVAVQGGETGSFATVTLNAEGGGSITLGIAELLDQYAAGGFVYRGTDRGDTLFGTAYADSMYGGLGNDVLYGNAGDDFLAGGAGDDLLVGGSGDDSYFLDFNTGRDTVVEDGAAEPLSVHTIRLGTGITADLLTGRRVGDDLQVSIEATGDALVLGDFYTQPESWQDNWLVRDAQDQAVNLTTLLSMALPPTQDWIADQMQAYRVQRERAFSAGRQADGFTPIGGTSHRREGYGFFLGGASVQRRTTIERMVQDETVFVGNDGSITTAPFLVPTQTITQTQTITVANPVFASSGAGRGAVQQSASQPGGGTASLPEGAMLWLTKSPFPGQLSGHGIAVSAGDVLIPVYGPRTGIPPQGATSNGGGSGVPSNIDNPVAYELLGYRVHHAVDEGQATVHETPVVNPTTVIPFASTIDEAYHVPDAVGGGESNTILARAATIVDAGGGNDVITLTAENNPLLPDGPDLKALFAGRDWRSGVAADALVDHFSPSESQYRYLAAHKSLSVRNREEARLADPASLLGGFVSAGAGDDLVFGSEARDTIAGGDGDDAIDGAGGSDTYLYTGNETGIDTLADSASDLIAYFDWFYANQGILNWDERLRYGGMYRFDNDDQDFATYEGTDYFPGGNPEDGDFTFIAPLPIAPPVLTRGDSAQLESLMASGVLSRDVVKFGPGLTLRDLDFQVTGGDTLSVRWGNAGFDVEIPAEDFGLGCEDLLSEGGMQAYRLGAGIETFQFADGSSYSLQEVLAMAAATIVGTPGDDVLTGTAADELFMGLEGDDTYIYGIGDGADTIRDSGGFDRVAFGAGITPGDVSYGRISGDLVLTIAGAGTLTVRGQFAEATRVEQFVFADGTVWDTLIVGTEDDDFLEGSAADDIMAGLGGSDTLLGFGGNDTVAGGPGSDDLEGGEGDDTYVYETGDGIDWIFDEGGEDKVRFGAGIASTGVQVTRDPYGTVYLFAPDFANHLELAGWFDSQSRIERVEFADGTVWDAAAIESRVTTAPATEGSDILNLSDGNDVSDGLGGDDRIFGNAGNDIIDGGDGNDSVEGDAGHNLLLGGPGDDFLAADYLDPAASRNFFIGGAGNDSIGTASAGNVVALNAGDGEDWLFNNPGDTFTLSVGGVSTADVTLHFENLDSSLRIGISSADAVTTYAYVVEPSLWPLGTLQIIGSDVRTYDLNAVVQAFLDVRAQDPGITEWSAQQALDANLLSVSTTEAIGGALAWQYATTGTLEALSIANMQAVLADADFAVAPQPIAPVPVEDRVLIGTDGNDTLAGGSGNDSLDGGLGRDTLIGGLGDDTYIVDRASDRVIENPDEGHDTVRSSVGYVLAANVEDLVLTGTANIHGTGNELANTITGNAGANVLDGGAGADILIGGAGNDTYIVDDPADVVIESLDEGTDTVKSSISYALPDNVENLILTGTAGIDGTANALDNVITGNEAANVLAGGAGDDTYVVQNEDDVVLEYADEGIDLVKSSVSFRLGANVEDLTLTGSADLNGFGNELANVIKGNSGANLLQGYGGDDVLTGNLANDILQGGSGNDTLRDNGGRNILDGGSGNDKLVGNAGNELFVGGSGNDTVNTGAGADIIAFNRGDGQDVVTASQGADNTLSLGGGIGYQDLAFKKSGSGLVLQLGVNPASGIQEQITFNGWYSATADNRSVAQLQIVAEAMDAFDPHSGDPLLASKIQTFDFLGLVDAFDAARAADSHLTTWGLSNALAANHLGASDTDAMGGDLAYAVGKNGSLEGMALDHAQAVLDDPGFGSEQQALTPIFEGGDGGDALTGDGGSDFFAGGGGDDTIETGGGSNVVAFNAGGGTDTIYSDSGASNTLSLGGGITYDDLSLSRAGNDLLLNAGTDDHVVLKDWYAGKDDVTTLQVILDASAAYDPDSQDPLHNGKVQTFDFRGLAQSFDQAYSESPGLTSWSLTNALLQWHLSHADDAALGGDLAYWYGKTGTLANIGVAVTQQTFNASGFGADAQQLHVLDGLQEGMTRLG